MDGLSPAETVALAGAVKDKDFNAAKSAFADGTSSTVDFSVRIRGTVQKGRSTPDTMMEVKPDVRLRELGHFCRLLRNLGIGPKRLATALRTVPIEVCNDQDLIDVFEVEEKARVDKLPLAKQTVKGRAGAMQSQVTATKL